VWRGHDVLLGRPVAVKVLRSEYTGDPTFLARFRAEAQHAASLSHPNIAAVYDYGEVTAEDGSGETLAYLVMELVEGEPLSAVLRREAPLDVAATLSVLRQTGYALGEAHRVGMVHRDVKPGNILVRADGSVKITDFGIAWSAGSVPLTRTGQVIGTAQYLSPEQAEGKHATPASDVYALGLVGYECLTGHAAFEGDNPVTIALKQVRDAPDPLPGELPPGVRTLIMRALDKDPAARYEDGAAFVDAVEDTIAGRAPETVQVDRPAEAVPPQPPRNPADPPTQVRAHSISPPVRRRRSLALVALALLVLIAGGAAGFLYLQRAGDDGATAAAAATKKFDDGQIVLVATDYVGRPVDEVIDRLTQRGLAVQLKPIEDPSVPSGNVTDVSPAGTPLNRGDSVLVTYVRAPGDTTVPRGHTRVSASLGDRAPAEASHVESPAAVPAQQTGSSAPTTAGGSTPSTGTTSSGSTSSSGSSSSSVAPDPGPSTSTSTSTSSPTTATSTSPSSATDRSSSSG
jgi:serine/threonine-protein kinase